MACYVKKEAKEVLEESRGNGKSFKETWWLNDDVQTTLVLCGLVIKLDKRLGTRKI